MEEGMSVLIDINGEKSSFAVLLPKNQIKIGKAFCSLTQLIGHPFGSVFELSNDSNGKLQLTRVERQPSTEESGNAFLKDAAIDAVFTNDNRNLVDDNSAQKLSAEEIEEMKRSGMAGKDIIQALVSHSATFESKTQFSKEKYMKKKQKKYSPRLIAKKPSAKSICEAYFAKSPFKIGLLRFDSLSLLLSLSNAQPFSDVLVLDHCGGLVTAAIAERMGGHGTICSTYLGSKQSSIDMIRLFNLSEASSATVTRASVDDLISCRTSAGVEMAALPTPAAMAEPAPIPAGNEPCSEPIAAMESAETGAVAEEPANGDAVKKRKLEPVGETSSTRAGRKAPEVTLKTWANNGFSSLVVASASVCPASAAMALLPLLSPSSPFVIYHPCLQPLAECMHSLQSHKLALNLQVSEPWLREYQVLPNRTHPHMQMSASGGYLLSGITVCPSEPALTSEP